MDPKIHWRDLAADGITLHIAAMRQGPLLLCHGGPERACSWRRRLPGPESQPRSLFIAGTRDGVTASKRGRSPREEFPERSGGD
jgi:hypothetical protein